MKLEPILKEQPWCGFDGEVAYNNFDRDITATIRGIEPAKRLNQDRTIPQPLTRGGAPLSHP